MECKGTFWGLLVGGKAVSCPSGWGVALDDGLLVCWEEGAIEMSM